MFSNKWWSSFINIKKWSPLQNQFLHRLHCRNYMLSHCIHCRILCLLNSRSDTSKCSLIRSMSRHNLNCRMYNCLHCSLRHKIRLLCIRLDIHRCINIYFHCSSRKFLVRSHLRHNCTLRSYIRRCRCRLRVSDRHSLMRILHL